MFLVKQINRKYKKIGTMLLLLISFGIICFFVGFRGYAGGEISLPSVGIDLGTSSEPEEVSNSIQLLLLLTILSIAPSIIIMMTSFTRIIIILSFLRNALGTQQMPPNQVLAGLALFLTLFIMNPVILGIYENAYVPYSEGILPQQEALKVAGDSIKEFMIHQTDKNDVALFASLANEEFDLTEEEAYQLPLRIVIPSFMISELTTAFKIGFFIYIPFLIIDMVIASTLMSMGMMMVPPVMISLPFKVLLFIMVGGWNIVAQTIVNSFNR